MMKCKYGIHERCIGKKCKHSVPEVGCVIEADDTTSAEIKRLHNDVDETIQNLIAYSMRLSELTNDVVYDNITDMLGEAATTLNQIKYD